MTGPRIPAWSAAAAFTRLTRRALVSCVAAGVVLVGVWALAKGAGGASGAAAGAVLVLLFFGLTVLVFLRTRESALQVLAVAVFGGFVGALLLAVGTVALLRAVGGVNRAAFGVSVLVAAATFLLVAARDAMRLRMLTVDPAATPDVSAYDDDAAARSARSGGAAPTG